MRTALFVIMAFVGGVIAGWQLRESDKAILSSQSFYYSDKLDEPQSSYLSAEGTWHASNLATKFNTAKILCTTGRCDIVEANVIDLNRVSYLGLYSSVYSVTQQDSRVLTATENSSPTCAQRMLVIDRNTKIVSLIRTKKESAADCDLLQDEPLNLILGKPYLYK
jgi:hypothetical protein